MPRIILNVRLRIPEDVNYHAIEDEMVLLHLGRGIYYGLDSVGRRLWELLAETGSLQAVFDTMAVEYEVAPEVLHQDILRLAEELQMEGLIEPA